MRTKEADTGKYTYRYADLGDVIDECKRALSLHGLWPTQNPSAKELGGQPMLSVTLELRHVDGGRLHFEPLMMRMPNDPQAYGSALTYAKRYQLLSIFEIAPEDDDGKEATTAARTMPGMRTEAERLIRETIGQFDRPTRDEFAAAFKAVFGSNLADLPAPRHGDALTWARRWQQERETAAAEKAEADQAQADAADEAWVAEAQ